MKKFLIVSLFMLLLNFTSIQIMASEAGNNFRIFALMKKTCEEAQLKKSYADGLQEQFETKLWYVSKFEEYNEMCVANLRAILDLKALQPQEVVEKQKAIFLKEEQSMLQAITNVAFKHHEKSFYLEELSKQLHPFDAKSIENVAVVSRMKELEAMRFELRDIANTYHLSKNVRKNSLYIFYSRDFNK